ncbi:hypothetical protein ACIBEJ_13910 [Nonomuraea sp. NPDC050790]|uniref:hypothetical protein n=1 Tax=Nonomuraea sp. NPDC050790 TaxID=3364371 RepID=UPI0037B86E43
MVRLTCQYPPCGREFDFPKGRGRYPAYCRDAHRVEYRAAYMANRGRTYQRCAHCRKVNELAWDEERYCSAMCFGIAALMAEGRSESAAKARVAEVASQSPELFTKRPPAHSGPSWEEFGFPCRSLHLLNAWEFSGGYNVISQETYLGGHRGPWEGRTCVEIRTPDLNDHEWFSSHPEWWDVPASAQ